MNHTAYEVRKIKDNSLLGYLVGKTQDPAGNRYLIVDTPKGNKVLPINKQTESTYRVDVVKVSVK